MKSQQLCLLLMTLSQSKNNSYIISQHLHFTSQLQRMIVSQSTDLLKLKTEKALEAINKYEESKGCKVYRSKLTLFKSTQLEFSPQEFQPDQVVRLQLLPSVHALYRIQYQNKMQPRLIIRSVRGGPLTLLVNYDRYSAVKSSDFNKFVIHDEVIVIFNSEKLKNFDWLYLQFINGPNLTMCNFKINLETDKKGRRGRVKTQYIQQSIANTNRILEEIKSSVSVKEQKQQRSYSVRKIEVSDKDIMSMRPEFKKQLIQQNKEKQQQKKLAALHRKEQVQIHRQKQAEARKVALKCRNLVEKYQELVEEENTLKALLIKKMSPLWSIYKFSLLSTYHTLERQNKMDRIFMIQHFRRRFQRKLLGAYRETRDFEPSAKMRQLTVAVNNIVFLGKCCQRKDNLGAKQLIANTILDFLPAMFVNQAMTAANKYRRHIRIVQKKWRTKYEARMQMLAIYGSRQVIKLFKKYPQFQILQAQYNRKKVLHTLCYQYVKESALKLRQHNRTYQNKLEEIADYKRLNQEIKKFNETALRKHHKELLEVPKKPAVPQHRFFRDLQFLKSLVRGWFELEYRRLKRSGKISTKFNSLSEKLQQKAQ